MLPVLLLLYNLPWVQAVHQTPNHHRQKHSIHLAFLTHASRMYLTGDAAKGMYFWHNALKSLYCPKVVVDQPGTYLPAWEHPQTGNMRVNTMSI
jgi:hypothetical protein